ncbi:cytoplasmic tRNA 2-thiolation protein 2 [Glossina fuscipes]|uniref:Cytoplasmic tRNA 2-thiolation protein 2 n=1 Tax=Glossina fuscipes TaxID=7396 RepID=A0A9C5ZBB4_9MUSC|nr:cytoplasmic tRNA 2-thiolation protein 2 [Glossina fuscipes]
MCNIEEDFGDEGAHTMIADEEPRTNLVSNVLEMNNCYKCGSSGAIYKLRFRQAECSDCFLLYARHKFRAALGSAKILPNDAKVMLLFDGSAESVVLLDMLHCAQSQGDFKRLCSAVIVLYVDELALIFDEDMELDDTRIILKTMQLFLANYNEFQSYIVPFLKNEEDVARSICQFSEINVEYLKRDVAAEQKFVECISQIQNLTSRQDFVKHQRNKLIARAAKHFNCQFTFKADINTTLASDLLTAICLGRGPTAANDVSLIDDRLNDGIKLVRPLRNLSKLEIDLYLKARSLKSLQCHYYGKNKGTNGSLQNLTRSFIDNLQTSFSSTVSTVYRTGDKIATKHDLSSNVEDMQINSCSFCCSILNSKQNSTTLLAVEFSRLVSAKSSKSAKNCLKFNSHMQYNVLGEAEGTQQISRLCHACCNIYRDVEKKNLLLQK